MGKNNITFSHVNYMLNKERSFYVKSHFVINAVVISVSFNNMP